MMNVVLITNHIRWSRMHEVWWRRTSDECVIIANFVHWTLMHGVWWWWRSVMMCLDVALHEAISTMNDDCVIIDNSMLGALCVVDDGMRNEDAWATLGQLLGFMFSQHTHGSSCLISDAPKGSLRGTSPVSPLKLDRWAVIIDSMWRHFAPHDALRPWQRRAMVGRDGCDDGQQ